MPDYSATTEPDPAAAPDWVTQLFASIDRKDATAFANFLTQDGQFRFGNQEPVRGRAAIAEAVTGFFSSIHSLSHRLERVWVHADSVVCHGTVAYGRLDGSRVILPFADVFYLDGDLVSDYLIFMDITPLYAS